MCYFLQTEYFQYKTEETITELYLSNIKTLDSIKNIHAISEIISQNMY